MPIIGGGSGGSGGGASAPGFEISYTQITAAVTIVSTIEATGTTIVSSGAVTFDGTSVYAELFCHLQADANAAGDNLIVSLFEGATQITELLWYRPEVALTAVSPAF